MKLKGVSIRFFHREIPKHFEVDITIPDKYFEIYEPSYLAQVIKEMIDNEVKKHDGKNFNVWI